MKKKTPYELLEEILVLIANHYSVTPSFILQRTRKNEIVRKRQLFFHFAVKYFNEHLSLREIGEFPKKIYKIKAFDHSTVLHSYRATQSSIKTYKKEKKQYDGIDEKIQYLLGIKVKPTKEVLQKIEVLFNQTNLSIKQLSKTYKISINHIEEYING